MGLLPLQVLLCHSFSATGLLRSLLMVLRFFVICVHVEELERNEGRLINTDNIQLWAGFRGGGLADVDEVQLWLVPAK